MKIHLNNLFLFWGKSEKFLTCERGCGRWDPPQKTTQSFVLLLFEQEKKTN